MNRDGSAVVTLPSDREMLVVRKFDSPASAIFSAWTTPEHVQRWWAGDQSQWLTCDIDLRDGGRWRYLTREPEGFEVGFHGEFRSIEAPYRIVYTEVFEGAITGPDKSVDDGAAVNTWVLAESDAVTTMSINTMYERPEHRDAAIDSGMEAGMQLAFDRLDAVVRGLSPPD
ncbi:uncharacterized protein YndB with AHSA1/START domain [Stackebrandtia endophytica]|uniref:Uncharacterized protein YndB with AHSA1/START domain n=1 Tax=Stackebrandtia endophytica TaxID=1496996 RepID=A0A543AX01_9ACTN|nr:SRPBCC family protein [Stackebrandtia endophytica]TQL77101.1 uncharacterized protein YndB with AHSA1/START domain [Stackebrandtia endophytica]